MKYRTVRFIHPPDWKGDSKEIRSVLEALHKGLASVHSVWDRPRDVCGETLHCKSFSCIEGAHMPHVWHVWAPIDCPILPYDGGACDICFMWKPENSESLHLYEIPNQHLLYINAFLSKRVKNIVQYFKSLSSDSIVFFDTLKYMTLQRSLNKSQKTWGFVLAEMKYRSLIPRVDELSVICDLCLEQGIDLNCPDPNHWDLSNLWARYAKNMRKL